MEEEEEGTELSLGMKKETREDDLYLQRGKEWIGTADVSCKDLMSHFRLEASLKKMQETTLPDGYRHLIRGLGLSTIYMDPATSSKEEIPSLVQVMEGTSFERPIEPIPEHLIQSGFQFPTGTSTTGAVFHSTKTSSSRTGYIHAPPSSSLSTQSLETTVTTALGGGVISSEKKESKKKEKKKKREREDAESLKTVLTPLIAELKTLTWKGACILYILVQYILNFNISHFIRVDCKWQSWKSVCDENYT